jgi:hypothetical protein
MAKNETLDEVSELKEVAVYRLAKALRAIQAKQPLLGHARQFGFAAVVSNVALEIEEARYDKVDEFNYAVLGMNDGHNVIVYRPETGTAHGIGVNNDDIFLEITLFDLVEWIVPEDKNDRHMTERLALLTDIIETAEKLAF